MKKNAAILLAALMLPAVSFAQGSQNPTEKGTDEGKPNMNSGPTRELTKLCKAEAKDKKLTGKDRSKFMRDCQANKVPPEGSSGASGASGSTQSSPGMKTDADGKPEGDVKNTSKASKKPVTNPGSSGAGTSTDADGKSKAK